MASTQKSPTAVPTKNTEPDLSWGEFCALVACAVAALGQADIEDIRRTLARLGIEVATTIPGIRKACEALVSKRMLFCNSHTDAYELYDDGEHDEWLADVAAIEWRKLKTAQEWLKTGIGQSTLKLFPE